MFSHNPLITLTFLGFLTQLRLRPLYLLDAERGTFLPDETNQSRICLASRAHQKNAGSKGGNTMLRFMLPVVATTAFIVSATSAFALESNVTVKSSMPPDAVWKKIGDFCGIKSWIPVVSRCAM